MVDAAHDAWHGACLRHVLSGSIAMAGEAATPGRLRVGVLRHLIGEALLLQHRTRPWAVSKLPGPAGGSGASSRCPNHC